MKFLKIVGIAFAALLVVVLAGMAFVASQFDAGRLKIEAGKVMQEKHQRTLKIDGDIKLSFWPNVGISLDKVSLSEHLSSQEFATIDAARIAVAVMPLLSRRVVVNDLQLNGLTATFIKRKGGTLNIDDLLSGNQAGAAATAEKKQDHGGEPLLIDIAGVNITNAALGWRDEQSGSSTTISGLGLNTGRLQADSVNGTYSVAQLSLAMKGKNESKSGTDNFVIKLEAPQLIVTPQGSGGENMTLSAVLSSPQRDVNARLALSGIDGKANALKIGKLVLNLEARMNETAIKGQFASALAADLGKQTGDLDKIIGSFEISHSQMPMKQLKLPLAGALHADLAKQSANGQLTTQFDESRIALQFGVTRFSPLALSFDLDVDKFNLDRYLPAKKPEEKAVARSAEGAGGEVADFSALKALNLAGTASVGQLQARNIKIGNLRLQMRIASGKLDIAPLSANLYEGKLNGAFSLNANDRALALRQNLTGISIAPLLKDVASEDLLEGHGSIALDVTSRGKTIAEMKKMLAGSASLSLRDGAIRGINLAQSFRDLKSQFGAKQDQVVQNKAADKTDFSELAASFTIASGIAHNEDLSAKSPFLRLAGSGDIDIGESRLNYLLKASIVATSGGQGAKDIGYLKGITVPVRLAGPFDKPVWKIEFADMASEVAKAKVEETKQKVNEKLKDKLKELFGK